MAYEFIQGQEMKTIMETCPAEIMQCESISLLRWKLDVEELRRLFCLSTWEAFWNNEKAMSQQATIMEKEFLLSTSDFESELSRGIGPGSKGQMKILFLPDESGGILFDIEIINTLLRLGHQVTLALKDGFYFYAPTIWDIEYDSVLKKSLNHAYFIMEPRISKNDLLHKQKENRFLVISDGTREKLNLYRTSVSFARTWKEADLIIAKGDMHYKQLILNSHEFTRDILCFYRDESNVLRLNFKKRSSKAKKYTEAHLQAKADKILNLMKEAKSSGKKVMFYSAIVGSIPGQTKTAIRILNTFVSYLRSRLENTFIINPAEYFEQGMDSDDLMFMWEKVQRSGLIDVWRFQTVEDIEKSFELLGESVPPVWIGKDATFSTGCTKEMNIALQMQKSNLELQIIGPEPSKFFRRREYGIGKFFDASIV